MRYRKAAAALLTLICAMSTLWAADVHALAQRTFVKSTGLDTLPGPTPNTCSLPRPCRTFAAALLQTQDKGEIIVLDSAGYGVVTINQSVSIIAPRGVHAGISVPLSAGAGVAVFGNDLRVVLEGLTIVQGVGSANGIRLSGDNSTLYVSRCSIEGLPIGVAVDSETGNLTLYASDVEVRGGLFGIQLEGAGVHAMLNRVVLEGHQTGLYVVAASTVSVRDSVIAGNQFGIELAAAASLTVEDSLIADNGFYGIRATSVGTTTADLRGVTIARNGQYGALANSSSAGGNVVMTIAGSVIAANGAAGVATSGPVPNVVLVNGNAISHNGSGLEALGAGIIHTRSNNQGEQATATTGSVIPVAGF
jgi:hypothetical protein